MTFQFCHFHYQNQLIIMRYVSLLEPSLSLHRRRHSVLSILSFHMILTNFVLKPKVASHYSIIYRKQVY